MKLKLKLSKKIWLGMGIGILVIAIITLGLLRLQQQTEQERLRTELETVQKRLAALELDQMTMLLQQTREQIAQTSSSIINLKSRISMLADSIAASDRLFKIAADSNIQIVDISASSEQSSTLTAIPGVSFPVNLTVKGSWTAIIDFITRLKSDFPTCMVEQANLSAADSENGQDATANLKLRIYNYKEN